MVKEHEAYKHKCDEVLLPRANKRPGVTFDRKMTNEQILELLQAAQCKNKEQPNNG